MNKDDDIVRYWVGVVSENHVRAAEQAGFAQVCHGKRVPLSRMKGGDWLVYYSPKTIYPEGAPLQSFTAIARVKDGIVYQVEISPGFIPNRINVDYVQTRNVKLCLLKERLHFCKENPRLGLLFRRGHFEIDKDDFQLISDAMVVGDAIRL
ncbi:EVE domain-containing protein [Alicyclobacillus fastidiosus]|uniref:UPF0310 protein NZD89_24925 n=1 Tax=Alicyclobacillus fastidiosus TaxID=392011 RepID=A0ABY6ZEX6_9BACL|nr:EVE domain-containing protein [Alicyclobacillus fastidiosus]WAH41449.1 EVE domain-containing protein [Alicyclobacillus fastidiosus]GMA63082.1 UPF0310 protein YdcG [Alicyclobacillus fastidiosus]